MSAVEFHFNEAGVEALLKSPQMRALVAEAANKIADHVRSQGIIVGGFKGQHGPIPLPVDVKMTTTDRAHGSVTIAHPAGIAVQAKHGALTKAAAAAGLQVNS